MADEKSVALLISKEKQEEFVLACKEAGQLQLVNNFGTAFLATTVVTNLRSLLTDEMIDKVFRPLANTRVGFMTDRRPTRKDPNPVQYSNAIIRDAIIEAAVLGLLPTGNQFNIIAERMYPTKEGFTALLKKMGVKYVISVGADSNRIQGYAEMVCRVDYSYNGDKNGFSLTATVKKDDYSSPDQLRGKAERRAKKALYEYITGCDVGDADEDSARVEDVHAEVVESRKADNANKANMPDATQQPPQGSVAQPQTPPAGSRDIPPLFGGQ